MPGCEIRHRIRSILLEWYEYLCYRLGRRSSLLGGFLHPIVRVSSASHQVKHQFGVFDQPERDRFFTEMIDRAKRLNLANTQFDVSTWVEQAEEVSSAKITLLGRPTTIPFSGGWQVDPVKGEQWPECFYSHVKKHHRIQSWDIKYIWEVNRHQYLIVLGKAFWLTQDERYAQMMISAINTWIDENPCHVGVNWTSSLELAVRTLSWIWSVYLCRDSAHMTKRFQRKVLFSILDQAVYIENHLSYYSSPYNHLIGEAAALHLIGSLFPFNKWAKCWEQLGWSIMADRIDEQFHIDGMCVEQASFYHHFTLGFYLQSIFFRRNNNKPIPQKVLDRVEKALRLALHLTKPDGSLPMIGDIDNARSLYFNLGHSWDFRAFLGLGAVLFGCSDFKRQNEGISEELLWLATEKDISLFIAMDSKPPQKTSIPFRGSGYFISRNTWAADADYLCFDCGEIAAGLSTETVPSAAHGHADALSFELTAHGRSMIVDGGFFTYFGDLAWHKHFRTEEAHNTVLVNGARQADFCGRLTWQKVRYPELCQWDSTERYDTVTGRMMLGADKWHERQIVYCKNHFWVLRDTVQNKSDFGTIQSFLHFAPEVKLDLQQERQELIASSGPIGLLIKYFGLADVVVKRGGESPDSGWVAPGYGIRCAAWRAVFSWKTITPESGMILLMLPFTIENDSPKVHSEHHLETGLPGKCMFVLDGTACQVDFQKRDQMVFSIGADRFRVPPGS